MRQHHNLRCARGHGIELNEVERYRLPFRGAPQILLWTRSSIFTGFNIWTESLKLQYVPIVRMVYMSCHSWIHHCAAETGWRQWHAGWAVLLRRRHYRVSS